MEGGRTGILRRMSLDEPSLTVLTSPSQFCGSVQSQYKQVGNAVPVNLAYEIGLEIHKSLEGVK